MSLPFSTLPALLASKSQESDVGVRFLDHNGDVSKELSYAALYKDALDGSRRLQSLCASLQNTNVDAVIASFADHEQHVRLFWACTFGELSLSSSLFNHLSDYLQLGFLSARSRRCTLIRHGRPPSSGIFKRFTGTPSW